MTQTNNVKGFEDVNGNVLTYGIVNDGEFLKRSGTNIVSGVLDAINVKDYGAIGDPQLQQY